VSTDHPDADASTSAAGAPGPGQVGPYETARQYAAGQLSREQVIDQLARWPYRPGHPSDGYDWTTLDPGEFNETVGKALSDGLLEGDTYDAVLARMDELER